MTDATSTDPLATVLTEPGWRSEYAESIRDVELPRVVEPAERTRSTDCGCSLSWAAPQR